jgi:hypothetical protein
MARERSPAAKTADAALTSPTRSCLENSGDANGAHCGESNRAHLGCKSRRSTESNVVGDHSVHTQDFCGCGFYEEDLYKTSIAFAPLRAIRVL